MDFDTYLATLPPPKKVDVKRDRMARKARKARDPLATKRMRLTATRLVVQAETKLRTRLDTAASNWPGVVSTLRLYTKNDWRALQSVGQLVPKVQPKPKKKAPAKKAAKTEKGRN